MFKVGDNIRVNQFGIDISKRIYGVQLDARKVYSVISITLGYVVIRHSQFIVSLAPNECILEE